MLSNCWCYMLSQVNLIFKSHWDWEHANLQCLPSHLAIQQSFSKNGDSMFGDCTTCNMNLEKWYRSFGSQCSKGVSTNQLYQTMQIFRAAQIYHTQNSSLWQRRQKIIKTKLKYNSSYFCHVFQQFKYFQLITNAKKGHKS